MSEDEGWNDAGVSPYTLTSASLLSPILLSNIKSIMQLSRSKWSFLDDTDAPGHEASNVTEQKPLMDTPTIVLSSPS